MMNLDDFQGRMFDLQETDLASPDRVARVSPKRLFATPQRLKCKGETNLTELNSSETETTRAKYDEEQGWRDRGGREGREAAINLRTSPCTPPVEKRETTGRHRPPRFCTREQCTEPITFSLTPRPRCVHLARQETPPFVDTLLATKFIAGPDKRRRGALGSLFCSSTDAYCHPRQAAAPQTPLTQSCPPRTSTCSFLRRQEPSVECAPAPISIACIQEPSVECAPAPEIVGSWCTRVGELVHPQPSVECAPAPTLVACAGEARPQSMPTHKLWEGSGARCMHEHTPKAQAREAVARVAIPSAYPQRAGKTGRRHAESCLSQCCPEPQDQGQKPGVQGHRDVGPQGRGRLVDQRLLLTQLQAQHALLKQQRQRLQLAELELLAMAGRVIVA